MKSEQETFEKLKEASSLKMVPDKQQEILHNIAQEMSRSKAPLSRKKKVNPLMNVFVGGAGLVATLAVVAGIYTFNNIKVNNQLGSSIPKTTQKSGKASISALSLPQPSDVVSIKWDHSFSGKPNHTWTKTNGASIIDQVIGWLNSAQVIESEPIGSIQKGGKPGITITTQSGTTVDVLLAYNVHTVKQSNGTSQSSWMYQKGYLVVSNHGFQNFQKPVQIYSPELANWIWNGWYGNTSVTPQGGTPTSWVEFTSAGLVSTYYILTNEHISTVGGLLGRLNMNDRRQPWITNTSTTQSVYVIPGVNRNKAVAVKMNDGTYVKAISVGSKLP